jgi:hypothetical protein
MNAAAMQFSQAENKAALADVSVLQDLHDK